MSVTAVVGPGVKKTGKILSEFGLIFRFIAEHKWRYIGGAISLICVDLLLLIQPRIMGSIADDFATGNLTRRDLFRYVGIVIGLAILIALGRYLWRMLVMGAARLLEYQVRNDFFRHLERLSQNYFNHHKIGDLMAHATNDIHAIRMAAAQGVTLSIDTLVLMVSTIAIMVRVIDYRLAILALSPMPLLVVLVVLFGRMIHRRFRSVQEAFAKLSDRVQEDFAGIRVIKSFSQEDDEIEKFRNANNSYLQKNIDLVRIWGAFGPLIQTISGLSFVIVLGYGGTLVMYGDISLGDFVAFTGYLGLLTGPVMAIGWIVNMVQRGTASLERINNIFREIPEITDAPDAVPIESIEGRIEIRSLTFTYPGRDKPALEDINLVIEKGRTLAIVGRSGSGKTTFVNLLVRLYNVEAGRIFIDGIDINKIPLGILRQNIGYVPQDNFLFSDSLKGNVTFGRRDATDELVNKAIESAQLVNDLIDFPEGLMTVVGERGTTLSGGQRQRACIARALIKDPAILILDDCLSAVDTATEDRILKRLKEIMQHRTSIVISHRVSTVKDADEIVVLDEGRIVEHGTHDELMAERGLYYDLYQRQMLEDELAARE